MGCGRGGGTCIISHMAMECVAYNVYVRLLTFDLSFDVSVAMVDLLLCSLEDTTTILS